MASRLIHVCSLLMRLCYIADANSIHTRRWIMPFVERGDEVHLLSYRPVTYQWRGLSALVDLTRLLDLRRLRFLVWGWYVARYVRAVHPDILPLGRLVPACYEAWYWGRHEYQQALEALRSSGAHVIHANDWDALPVAIQAGHEINGRVILDLHEYAPLESEDRPHWRLFVKPMVEHFLRKYSERAVAHVTVNETIAERYAREYGFRPIVIRNAPYCDQGATLRRTDAGRIRLVHHGVAKRDRKLELMIEAVAQAEARYSLDMILIDSGDGYLAELIDLARRRAPERVSFQPPVPPAEVVRRLAEYDMGIFILPRTNFNNAVAFPNRFFDFVAAVLAVLVGPSVEMARLAREFGFGIATESFSPEDAAAILNCLSAADIDQMKLQALEARKTLNADVEMSKLVSLYDTLSLTHCGAALTGGERA
jgi:hypothetical protein